MLDLFILAIRSCLMNWGVLKVRWSIQTNLLKPFALYFRWKAWVFKWRCKGNCSCVYLNKQCHFVIHQQFKESLKQIKCSICVTKGVPVCPESSDECLDEATYSNKRRKLLLRMVLRKVNISVICSYVYLTCADTGVHWLLVKCRYL